MNVQQEIDRAIETIKKTGKMIRFLREHQQLVDSLRCPVDIFNGRVDFNYPTHSETIQIIKAFGGKWKKELNPIPGKINYESVVNGMSVRMWAGDPPPSCRIVEVEQYVPEQVIPASTIKVRKMVCQPALAAVIAIARDNAGALNQPAVVPDVVPL